MEIKKFFTVRESARRYGCTIKHLYDLIWSGRLVGARKVGGVWRIPKPVLQARVSARRGRANGTAGR